MFEDSWVTSEISENWEGTQEADIYTEGKFPTQFQIP